MMNENEIKLSKEIESMAKKNDEDTSLTRKMIGNVEAALTEKIEKIEKDLKQTVDPVADMSNNIKNLRTFMNVEINRLRSDNHNVLANHLNRIAVLEKSLTSILESSNREEEERIQCPVCKSYNLKLANIKFPKEYREYLECNDCGEIFSANEEKRTELQEEIEGLTFAQLVSRFVKQRGAFATFQDSLIYIDWLYREIIEDLRQIIDFEGDSHFVFMDSKKEKYEKLFKEK